MDRKQADEELKQIQIRLSELNEQRQAISVEEHRLVARRHDLMFLFYPDVINDQINKLLQLRRLRRGDLWVSSIWNWISRLLIV